MMILPCVSFILVFAASVNLAAQPSPKESLDMASSLLNQGNYKKALEAINDLDIRHNFDDSDDMKMAFKIKAIAYEKTHNTLKAAEIIRELLFLDPDYNFDPFDTPVAVLKLAEQEKALIADKNKYLASIKMNKLEAQQESKQSINWKPKLHPTVTLLPLGLNHYYLGNNVKGSIYLSLQTLGLLANIGGFWWKQSYLSGFGSGLLKDPSYKNRFDAAQTVQLVGLASFLVGFSISVIDALLSLKNQTAQN